MFNSYVSLPEGIIKYWLFTHMRQYTEIEKRGENMVECLVCVCEWEGVRVSFHKQDPVLTRLSCSVSRSRFGQTTHAPSALSKHTQTRSVSLRRFHHRMIPWKGHWHEFEARHWACCVQGEKLSEKARWNLTVHTTVSKMIRHQCFILFHNIREAW